MFARARERIRESASVHDLRILGEATLVIIATWLLLGWRVGSAITQADGTWLVIPYTDGALDAGFDWQHYLYRFGVIGGSEMHPFGGSLPLVQVAAPLGLSTTLTVNLVTWFIQLCYAFFGIRLGEAIRGTRLSPVHRVIGVWLVAFAPVLGWRLALGHENLLLGFLPLFVVVSLLWQSRDGRPSVVALVLASIAVFHGVSGLGAQGLVYSAVFGLPIAIASALPILRTGSRRALWGSLVAVAAGIAFALPRIASMIAHAVGDDTTRGLGEAVKSSYGVAPPSDWLHSIPWTIGAQPYGGLHEHNYPLGPLVLALALLWPRQRSRALPITLAVTFVLVILFACEIGPVKDWLHALVPPLDAFRGPSRAALAVLIFVAPMALAGFVDDPALSSRDRQRYWLALLLGAALILATRGQLGWLREVLAWISVAALVVTRRWLTQRARYVPGALVAVVAALGVAAFGERIPRNVPEDAIEDGPAAVRVAVHEAAPELASALDRVAIVDAPPPYEMSMAFAARLPSIDGVWYPPRRFVSLLSALNGRPLPPTMSVYRLSRSAYFPVLQQLYNVRAVVRGLGTPNPTFGAVETLGAAWFPSRIELIDEPSAMISALRAGGDLRSTIARTGWVLREDAPSPSACAGARVLAVSTDELGQQAIIAVEAPAPCTLVVATNYTSTLRARAASKPLRVLPIDVALTGVEVPAGPSTIVLAPELTIPWWTRIVQLIGIAAILALAIQHWRARS
jgi:hypothetical protein